MLNKKMHLKSPTARANPTAEINLNSIASELLSQTQQATPTAKDLLLKGTPGGPGQRITAEQSARAIVVQKSQINQDHKTQD